MFAIDAFEAQSGKTLLGSIAGALATGREITIRPWEKDEYQRTNALAMALESGDPVLLFDNLESSLASATFSCRLSWGDEGPSYLQERNGFSAGSDWR